MLTWYDDILITQLKVVFHWSKSRLTSIQTINQDKLIWGDDFAEFSFSSFSLAFRSIWNDPGIWPNIMRLYLGAFRACNISYPSALLDFSLFLWFSRAIMLRRRLIHFCAWVESKSCCSHSFGVWTSMISVENVWTKPASDISNRLHAGVRNGRHHSLNTFGPPICSGLLPVFSVSILLVIKHAAIKT